MLRANDARLPVLKARMLVVADKQSIHDLTVFMPVAIISKTRLARQQLAPIQSHYESGSY